MKEKIDLDLFGGTQKDKRKIVKNKYPSAIITPLWKTRKLTKWERIIDNLLGFFTDAPFGVPKVINDIKDSHEQYYLVEEEEKTKMAIVTDDFIEVVDFGTQKFGKKFEYGDFLFRRNNKTV